MNNMVRVWLDSNVFFKFMYRVVYFGPYSAKTAIVRISGDVVTITNGPYSFTDRLDYFIKNLQHFGIFLRKVDEYTLNTVIKGYIDKLDKILDILNTLYTRYRLCYILEPAMSIPQRLLNQFKMFYAIETYIVTDFDKLQQFLQPIKIELEKIYKTIAPATPITLFRGLGEVKTYTKPFVQLLYEALSDIIKLREVVKKLSRAKGRITDYSVDAWLILLSMAQGNYVVTSDSDVAYFTLRIANEIKFEKFRTENYIVVSSLSGVPKALEELKKKGHGIVFISNPHAVY